MNVNSAVFVPFANRMERLIRTPFFQQRLEQFIFKEYRSENGSMNDISILAQGPSIPNVVPHKKGGAVFLGLYKGHVIVYEADRIEDPRTGHFRRLIQSP